MDPEHFRSITNSTLEGLAKRELNLSAIVGKSAEAKERPAKRNYQFCSADCRETFYAKAPDYHDRKAKNQRAYRQRLKQAKREIRRVKRGS